MSNFVGLHPGRKKQGETETVSDGEEAGRAKTEGPKKVTRNSVWKTYWATPCPAERLPSIKIGGGKGADLFKSSFQIGSAWSGPYLMQGAEFVRTTSQSSTNLRFYSPTRACQVMDRLGKRQARSGFGVGPEGMPSSFVVVLGVGGLGSFWLGSFWLKGEAICHIFFQDDMKNCPELMCPLTPISSNIALSKELLLHLQPEM